MKKGVFSMYSTKGKQPTFFIHEYAYPKHKKTEVSVYICNSISHDIACSMKHCVRSITNQVISQAHTSSIPIKRGDI